MAKVCPNCDAKVISEYKCSGCGKEIIFNYHANYNLELKQGYGDCNDCRFVFSDYFTNCGKYFEMDGGEFDFYKSNGSLPKCCPTCRNSSNHCSNKFKERSLWKNQRVFED